jgi:hypothetical protein
MCALSRLDISVDNNNRHKRFPFFILLGSISPAMLGPGDLPDPPVDGSPLLDFSDDLNSQYMFLGFP